MSKINTTKSVKENKVTLTDIDNQIKDAAKVLGEQKKVEVLIPAYLKDRLGPTVDIGINGAVVTVPVGKKEKIPESMAEVLNESLNNLNL